MGEEKINFEEEKLKKKSLKYSIYEGSSFSLMDGFGSRYLTPYAVSMNLSNTFISLLSTIPNFIGSLLQMKGLRIIEKRSRKKIVISGVLFQAFMWLPLIGVGAAYFFLNLNILISSILLVLIYTLLVAGGSFSGPAWSSWMRDLIPKDAVSYFGKRNSAVGVVSLASLLLAGAILSVFNEDKSFFGFAILFFIAFLGRSLSGYLFTKHYEPKLEIKEGYYFSFFDFFKKMPKNNFGRFTIFSSLVTFATAIASPFFAVYMLRELGFSYFEFTLIIISSIFANFIFQPFWGKFADKFGNINVIKLCGFFIFLVPLLWFVSPLIFIQSKSFLILYLFLVEFFSGFVWAGFDLSTGTFAYYAVTKERLPLCSTYMNVLISIGSFFGALLGGIISSSPGLIFGISAFLFIFLLSAIMRFIVIQSLVSKLKETKKEVTEFKRDKIKEFFVGLISKEMNQGLGTKRIVD